MPDDSKEKYDALKLYNDGKENEKWLMTAIAASGLALDCYAYKSRVKSEDKILEKVSRKRKLKPNYQIKSITDIVGLRLVTLFRRDMPKMLGWVIRFISHDIDIKPNPFLKNSFNEFIVYSTNPTNDVVASTVEQMLSEIGCRCEIKQSNEGYSSIHIVSSLQVRDNLTSPIELQIRTVFEDAWGEVDHKLGYSIREGKNADPIQNSESIQRHLKVLKRFTDSCAEYADVIYEEAFPNSGSRYTTTDGKVISVGSDSDLREDFIKAGMPIDTVERFLKLRDAREAALANYERDPGTGSAELLDIAKYFAEFAREGEAIESIAPRIFFLYSSMNQAICYLSINGKEYANMALDIYSRLEGMREFSCFPFLKFRMAQSLGKLGRTDEAIKKYKEAQISAKQLIKKQGKNGYCSLLPEADYSHLKSRLPKLLGYQLWAKSQSNEIDLTERLSLLKEAFNVTRPLLKLETDIKNISHAHNNLLYYAVEYCQLAKENSLPTDELAKDTDGIIKRSLAYLEKHPLEIEKSQILEFVERSDTLLRAYDFVGEKAKTLEIAESIVSAVSLYAMNSDADAQKSLIELMTYAAKIKESIRGI